MRILGGNERKAKESSAKANFKRRRKGIRQMFPILQHTQKPETRYLVLYAHQL